ncbi:MAG TPA: methylmalonyl-CoA mutase family protein, partial [Bacteroidia bacterium]|nr:methylmalonyl-CoA mutase family protein [Bacteroidia bacterium]
DLKGEGFEKLIWHNPNGFDINPFYTSEDLNNKPEPLFTHKHWDVCEQITVNDEKKANKRALKALQGGASGLSFYIYKKMDTVTLLKNISLEHIYTQFFISNDAFHVLNDLKNVYGKINPHDGQIKCFVNIDPLSLFAFYGEWHDNEEKDLSVLEQMLHIPVNVSLYSEAGTDTVTELAIGLAHTNEYFNYLESKKLLKDKTLHFTFSSGTDFFTEIAKLRAFRKLVTLLQQQYKVNFKIHIHAQTTQQNKSNHDAYNNMLRTTTEGMSAVIGGCNSLSVLPYNETFEEASEFSARISRNQQLIFKEESYLDKVADIGAGSYYIEKLTDELAEKAWEEFKIIESKGGFIACMKSGFLQTEIKKQAEILITKFKEEKIILVGVNKFQNKNEKSKAPSQKSQVNTMITAIKPICLSDYLVKENA